MEICYSENCCLCAYVRVCVGFNTIEVMVVVVIGGGCSRHRDETAAEALVVTVATTLDESGRSNSGSDYNNSNRTV